MVNEKNINVYLQKLRLFLRRFNTSNLFDEIARRAFVNNAFDGALTLLGILMGNLILDEINPRIIITTGYGACLAMGMSGAFGRYFSERAERKRTLKQVEDSMLADLSGSILEKESKKKIILISLVDGLSPAIAAAIPLIPFFLAQASLITINSSVVASLILDFFVLFILGVFLGKTSGENVFLHGFLIVIVGFVTSVIIFISSFFFNNL